MESTKKPFCRKHWLVRITGDRRNRQDFVSWGDGHENSLGLDPADGASLIAYTFSQWYYVVIYLVWFAALWFHLTHGVWSMFQTVGWANDTWYPRLKCIANIVATIIFLGFAAVVLVYFFCPCIAGAC